MQKTCIVIPCYNEALRLDFGVFESFIKASNSINFLFVNDGSVDNTLELLQQFKSKQAQRISVLDMSKNVGKAEAVRKGILEASKNKSYEFVGFWDADLSTPLTEIVNFLSLVIDPKKNIAMGSRMKRLGATVERKASRHLFGRVFSTFSSIILKLPVYDTQCGAKLFRADLCVLFEEKFITKWLFDVELLARYRNKFGVEGALKDIIEVPVGSWIEKGGSKLKLTHMIKVPIELLSIYFKYK